MFVTHELPYDDCEPVQVQPTFVLRYSVTPYWQDGMPILDPEVLDVSLLSAKCWLGEYYVEVVTADPVWARECLRLWDAWYVDDRHAERIGELILADYENETEQALIRLAEARAE